MASANAALTAEVSVEPVVDLVGSHGLRIIENAVINDVVLAEGVGAGFSAAKYEAPGDSQDESGSE